MDAQRLCLSDLCEFLHIFGFLIVTLTSVWHYRETLCLFTLLGYCYLCKDLSERCRNSPKLSEYYLSCPAKLYCTVSEWGAWCMRAWDLPSKCNKKVVLWSVFTFTDQLPFFSSLPSNRKHTQGFHINVKIWHLLTRHNKELQPHLAPSHSEYLLYTVNGSKWQNTSRTLSYVCLKMW